MKLHEINAHKEKLDVNGLYTDEKDIVAWMTANNIPEQVFSISHDLTVAINSPNNIIYFSRDNLEKLPINFSRIRAIMLKIENTILGSLTGLPDKLECTLDLQKAASIYSYETVPYKIGSQLFLPAFANSLIGISSNLNQIGFQLSSAGLSTRNFFCDLNKIDEGGLGLLQIEGLTNLGNPKNLPEPFEIIAKYLSDHDKIFECQQELIEAGFEEYAQL